MNICIDMRPALSRSTGVGVYLENLVEALARADAANQYHLFSSSWKERYRDPGYGPNFIVHDRRIPVSLLNFAWNRFGIPSVESLTGARLDVAHSPGPLMIPARKARRIITVHDLYFYAHPEHTAAEIRRDYAALVRKHCEQCDAIIAISETTRLRLMELLNVAPSRICTIRHGADPFYAAEDSKERADEVLRRFSIRPPFFLYAGSREPRKNLPALLRAFSLAKTGARLVMAGPGEGSVREPDVVETGYVSREELRILYRSSLAMVLVSLDEGFGLPLLEAMQAGTPILASDIAAFREVAGDAFLAVDPASPEAIAEALRRLLEDESLRQRLVAAGKKRAATFSWDDAARRTLELYESL